MTKVVTSYRVSFFDQFVVVIDWPGTAFSRRWSLWDLSAPSAVILDDGVGDPPVGHFPMGVLPKELQPCT